jgi:tungstate transport system substrate-binding protein
MFLGNVADRGDLVKRLTGSLAAFFLLALAAGCGNGGGKAMDRRELILATTTSTRDSGLLEQWIPMFEKEYPYSVKVIAVGSGQAMEMGRNGECDVMLVHSPAAEEEMVARGYAVDRRAVMHNDFVVLGPAEDPAGIRGKTSAGEAFAAVAASGSKFVSRGDDSGTHIKELCIWGEAGIEPRGEWYVESGEGMGNTLRIASEEKAYTLSDRGTYLSMKGRLDLEILVEGDTALFNNYHVMMVNPERYPDVNVEGARAFADFVTGRRAQELLETFGVDEYGEPLFFPDAP